jgi:hypothetical protein
MSSKAQKRLQSQQEVFMSSPSTITLIVPRAKTESLFLRAVVQAAILAYRGNVNVTESHNLNAIRFEGDPGADFEACNLKKSAVSPG